MGLPSTKDRVWGVFEAKSSKGEVKSSVETKEENTENKKLYTEIVLHRKSFYLE